LLLWNRLLRRSYGGNHRRVICQKIDPGRDEPVVVLAGTGGPVF